MLLAAGTLAVLANMDWAEQQPVVIQTLRAGTQTTQRGVTVRLALLAALPVLLPGRPQGEVALVDLPELPGLARAVKSLLPTLNQGENHAA